MQALLRITPSIFFSSAEAVRRDRSSNITGTASGGANARSDGYYHRGDISGVTQSASWNAASSALHQATGTIKRLETEIYELKSKRDQLIVDKTDLETKIRSKETELATSRTQVAATKSMIELQ